MSLTKKILHERRVVVVFQLGVLLLILVGLFSAALIQPSQTANIQDTVDIKTIPLEQKDESSAPESISETTVRAKAAYVWDIKNQRALYIKNADTPLPLASITKLMTSLLAYEITESDMNATISVRAVGQEGSTGLVPGEQMTMNELNSLSLISSSNDAAFALGANAGSLLGNQDPSRQFVEGMNIRAAELNLKTLSFKNTTGLDISTVEPGAMGSARDVSFLMEYILQNYPEVLEPTTLSAARIYNQNGQFHDVENTNDAIYAIPNLLGSKTGYTDLAGGNLTIAFDAGLNRPIVVTVLGSTREERFSDVLALVKSVRANISDI
jgi:D-alanyl-D-alanine carboxypeptidase